MKNTLLMVLGSACLALLGLMIISTNLSDEAMAVVVGAVCGISASIPMSIGLVIAERMSQPSLADQGQFVIFKESRETRGDEYKRLTAGASISQRIPASREFKIIDEE